MKVLKQKDAPLNKEVFRYNCTNKFSKVRDDLSKQAKNRLIQNGLYQEIGALQSVEGKYFIDTFLPDSGDKVQLQASTLKTLKEGIPKAKELVRRSGWDWEHEIVNDRLVRMLKRCGIMTVQDSERQNPRNLPRAKKVA